MCGNEDNKKPGGVALTMMKVERSSVDNDKSIMDRERDSQNVQVASPVR